jgi:hypothetical protein
VASDATTKEASPSLGAANCETVAKFAGPGGSSGVVLYANQNEASPSLGAVNCEAVANFGDSWEAHRGGATRRSE